MTNFRLMPGDRRVQTSLREVLDNIDIAHRTAMIAVIRRDSRRERDLTHDKERLAQENGRLVIENRELRAHIARLSRERHGIAR